MNQKGFIQIIFIIIIGAVVATSTTFGVVKYKDEITANVSKVFQSKIEAPNTELRATEEPITEGEQNDAQKLQEKFRISEQKKLEAEQQLAEEKAKQKESARIKAEQELQKRLEAQKLSEEQKKQEESVLAAQQLEIEKCKAEAQSVVDKFLAEINKMYLEAQKTLQNWEQAIVNARTNYAKCMIQPTSNELLGASPYLQQQVRNSECSYYLTEATRLQSDLSQKTISVNNVFQSAEKLGQTEYSRIYLKCLNK